MFQILTGRGHGIQEQRGVQLHDAVLANQDVHQRDRHGQEMTDVLQAEHGHASLVPNLASLFPVPGLH